MIVVLISTLECCKPCTSSRLVAQKKCTVKPGLRPGPRACLGFGGLGLGPEKSQARARSGPAQARASRPSPARKITTGDGTNLDLFCSADEFRTVLVVEERTMTLHGCHILMDMDVAPHHMSTDAPTRWSLILDTFCTLD